MKEARTRKHSPPTSPQRSPAPQALLRSARAPRTSSTGFDPAWEQIAGVHRIQRVPDSEKRGRRHSSLVTVVALPDSSRSTVTIGKGDVRVDTYRDTGPGGQHRNKTDSAVRLTHLPTGVVVTAPESRSQHENRRVAWERLQSALQTRADSASHAATNGVRAAAVGDGRSWTWTAWRDEVRSSDGRRARMSSALAGRFRGLVAE